MLQAEKLTKCFGCKTAVDHVDLTLRDGCIFGLLGTNGAGKSTLLRMLSGIFHPDEGTVMLDNSTVWENPDAKGSICYLSDDPAFLHGATIADMAKMQSAYYTSQDNEYLHDLCKRFHLPENERITGFSKGTQKRAQIVLGLSRRPKVLLCDETFDGLDPVMRESFKALLSEATLDHGLCTVLAGHNQQEMEDICDSVGFLHEGKLVKSGDLESIVNDIHKIQCVLQENPDERILNKINPLRVQRQGRLLVLTVRGEAENTMKVLQTMQPVYAETLPLTL